jgi:rare lipoprotein A
VPVAAPAPAADVAVTRSIKSAWAAPEAPVADAPAALSPPAPAAVTTITVVRPAAPAARPEPAAPPPFKTASTAPTATPDTAADPHLPRAVATLTVNRQTFKQDTRGYHGCSSGDRNITSFYWEGKHTASGEKFEPDRRFAAAHRSLPFGTRLMITNPRTGKSVIVTVNDRGPYAKGVTLDLTRSAALAIGMQGTGAVCMAKL